MSNSMLKEETFQAMLTMISLEDIRPANVIKTWNLEGHSIAGKVLSLTKKITAGKLLVDGGSFHPNEHVSNQTETKLL